MGLLCRGVPSRQKNTPALARTADVTPMVTDSLKVGYPRFSGRPLQVVVTIMIVECLMERYGWHDVWYLGSNRPERYRHWWSFVNPSACYVGIWTGPDLELLCVRRCVTAEEAEQALSPAGWTIVHAAIRAWLKLRSIESKRSPSPHDISINCTTQSVTAASSPCQERMSREKLVPLSGKFPIGHSTPLVYTKRVESSPPPTGRRANI